MAIFFIGDRVYQKKGDALGATREVRERVAASLAQGGVVDLEDDDFLRDLVALHPDAENKVGCGIARFEVRQNLGNTDGFWIIRTDGSETDFSFMKCLYGASHEADVRSAMRYAIMEQMQAARDREFGSALSLVCPVTSAKITRETAHIDHESPTFVEIADEFAEQQGGYERIETASTDGAIGRRLVSDDLLAEWKAFHAGRARLRAVSKAANLSILRRGVARRQKKSL
jgi:hypothetical protein